MQKKPCNKSKCSGKAYYFDFCMSDGRLPGCTHPEYFSQTALSADTGNSRLDRINELINGLAEIQRSMLVMKQALYKLRQEEYVNARQNL